MTAPPLRIARLDYSVLQQCMRCGMCLPSCPTYEATRLERSSPRGRIALMRALADARLPVTREFAQEMYFCLGCLACTSACPAGVNYAEMFELARADVEQSGVLASPKRNTIRWLLVKAVFTRPRLLRLLGRFIYMYQAIGLQRLLRAAGLTRLLPRSLRQLEPLTPTVQARFSDALINQIETPPRSRYRVGLLTGCVQDLVYSHVNRDTADVLLAHQCTVFSPRVQSCCGSLHAHNGELELAREMARRNILAMERCAGSLDRLDAIISNAGGCGSHIKGYGHLLQDDPEFAARAKIWSTKLRDIHEWLVQIGLRPPTGQGRPQRVTYHESCHLVHGQKVSSPPRQVLSAIPGLELVELAESNWCCGSAGIYNITQPAMARQLSQRKVGNIARTGANVVASANPGCSIQLEAGLRAVQPSIRVAHPVSLLAEALRQEPREPVDGKVHTKEP